MNVDPGAYPSLGPDQNEPAAAEPVAASETPAAIAPAASDAASAAAMAAAVPKPGGTWASVNAAPPMALIVAIAAAIVAVAALGFAWFTYDNGRMLLAQVQAQAESDRLARHAVAAGLALQQLGARARAGGPFTQELQLTRELAGDDAASREFLDALAPFAAHGLPSLQLLQASFSRAVLQPARRAIPATMFASFSSLIERMLPNGRGEIEVPRAGLEELFEAERAVIAGDLQTAVVAAQPYLDTLPQARQWVAIAEHRLRAEKALTDIDTLVWQKLGGAR